MKATRRSVTVERGDTRIRVESETVRHTLLDHLLGRRRPTEEVVLSGPWWALQTRTRYGYHYERLRPATREELITYAHLNINPHTAAWARSTMIEPTMIEPMSMTAPVAPPRGGVRVPELPR